MQVYGLLVMLKFNFVHTDYLRILADVNLIKVCTCHLKYILSFL